MEIEIFVVGIDHDKKTLVDVALTARSEEFACRSAQNIAERQCYRIVPILAGRFFTRGSDPGDVFDPSIGTPSDNSRVASRLRFCRSRRATRSGSDVGPSTPQFQLLSALLPSRLSSPLA